MIKLFQDLIQNSLLTYKVVALNTVNILVWHDIKIYSTLGFLLKKKVNWVFK